MADERIKVEYLEPSHTITNESAILVSFTNESAIPPGASAPNFYDECNWKTYERILYPGPSGAAGAAQYIDDVDTGGQQSNAT